MISTLPSLLERPVEKNSKIVGNPPGTLTGIELALHRAEPYLLAGWRLTPEEILQLTGPEHAPEGSLDFHGWPSRLEEDDLEGLDDHFGGALN